MRNCGLVEVAVDSGSADAELGGDLGNSELASPVFVDLVVHLPGELRLPQEGPCECDLVLTCSKFLTTSDYAPRLVRRRQVELNLVQDAVERGWDREVERHQRTADRLQDLLTDLGHPTEQDAVTTDGPQCHPVDEGRLSR